MNFNHMIDHTLLKPEATEADIVKLCREAKENDFASVCINPLWVKTAAQELADSKVKVCTVIGFPLGASAAAAKAFEAARAIEDGAQELDMVLAVGLLKAKEYEAVLADIQGVVQAAQGKALVKVIIEACLLTDEEKIKACQLAEQAGADFVKTSTGFSTGGATAEDVALMRQTVSSTVQVKAAGGIRTAADAEKMVKAGATRLGTSNGLKIIGK